MAVKTLPTQEVKAMGLKLEGFPGSDFAEDLLISLITPTFQELGKTERVIHLL